MVRWYFINLKINTYGYLTQLKDYCIHDVTVCTRKYFCDHHIFRLRTSWTRVYHSKCYHLFLEMSRGYSQNARISAICRIFDYGIVLTLRKFISISILTTLTLIFFTFISNSFSVTIFRMRLSRARVAAAPNIASGIIHDALPVVVRNGRRYTEHEPRSELTPIIKTNCTYKSLITIKEF